MSSRPFRAPVAASTDVHVPNDPDPRENPHMFPVRSRLLRHRVAAIPLAALALACVPVASAAAATTPAVSSTPGEPVNPFTGQPRSLEATQRRLEQLRLETQVLEEEARQATLRGTIAAARGGTVERAAGLPGLPPASQAPNAMARPGGPRRPQPPAPPVVARPGAASPAPATDTAASRSPTGSAAAPAGAQLLAILRDGERRRAVLQMGLGALTVQEGDEVGGMRVGPIGDNALTLDGRMLELLRGSATVPLADRRPAGGLAPAAPNLPRPQAPLPLVAPASGTASGSRTPAAASPWPALPPLPAIGDPGARSMESPTPAAARPQSPPAAR